MQNRTSKWTPKSQIVPFFFFLITKKHELLQVMEVESITLDSIKSHTGLWVLLSKQINNLDEIELFEHCQTVTVSGVDKPDCLTWSEITLQPMKRIVPAGQALAFSHIWDGIDLIEKLSININK